MATIAHIADVHLGAFRDERLRELNLQAFEKALDECARRNVDFIIIAGDLFNINIPDLGIVERAVKKMKAVGRPIYAVYGSHDYSPTQTSVIDVLNEAGVLKKVSSGEYADGKLKLSFVKDEKTGVKITGISARKLGLEKSYYQDLDTDAVEKETGEKIFVFHCAVAEFKPTELQRMDAMQASLFPKGFSYYAGGHVHSRMLADLNGGKIAQPGPLFAADFRDLDGLSQESHGFYMVDLAAKKVEFTPVEVCSVKTVRANVDGLSAGEADERIQRACTAAENADVILLHVHGTLKQGKPSEIRWAEAREALEKKCAIVYVNRAVETGEREQAKVDERHPDQIAEKIFYESLANAPFSEGLKGDTGRKKSFVLLEALKEENAGEPKTTWENKMVERGRKVLE